MNTILHGIDAPNIIHTNTLAENPADIQDKDRMDVVMANRQRLCDVPEVPIPLGGVTRVVCHITRLHRFRRIP
jgi:hypothetical protein